MPSPPQDDVRSALEPFDAVLASTVLGAWSDWMTSPHVPVWRCNRSRANFVWEQIIERAHLAFSEDQRIRIMPGHETFQFLASDRVLFRFKKGDESGLSANVPTQLALAFHDHEQDLFGLPEVHRIDIVYKLNRLETEVADVLVIARDGDSVAWSYSLLDRAESVILLPVEASPAEPEGRTAARLVSPREQDGAAQNKRD